MTGGAAMNGTIGLPVAGLSDGGGVAAGEAAGGASLGGLPTGGFGQPQPQDQQSPNCPTVPRCMPRELNHVKFCLRLVSRCG